MHKITLKQSLREAAHTCLVICNPDEKVKLSSEIYANVLQDNYSIDEVLEVNQRCDAGFPDKPELVASYELPKRSVASANGHAALLHSFAHIEFNAINIAWDAVYRFNNMPAQFYLDWAKIAAEEAYHFSLIRNYLLNMGYDYGSFQAHTGLWDMVEKTSHDVLVRMALVPRVLEARGLDVTPVIIKKFRHHNFIDAADIMTIIYQDEIGHVEIGTKWFKFLCKQRQLDSDETFNQLIQHYAIDKIRKPFNDKARQQAGFSAREMELLNICSK